MRRAVLVLAIMALLAATNALAEEGNKKYQNVFYPNGMPIKSYIEEGQTKYYPTEYELCDELDLPNSNLKIVVFSQSDSNKHFDNLHRLFISIIQQNGNSWNIKYLNEISDYIKISAEPDPGYMDELKGVLEHFNVSGYDAVHLNLYALLSGTGGISSDSDIFFLIQNSELIPVLELLGNVEGSRGPDYSRLTWTFIYFADVDSDGYVDILTQVYNYKKDVKKNIYVNELSNNLSIYKFNISESKYKLDGQIASLPSNAIKVRRYFEAKVPVTDCCP